MNFTLLATCAFGLESVLKRELIDLGYEPKGIGDGKIVFNGDVQDIIRANVWLRTANRVLILLHQFHAETFDELFEGVKTCAWEELLDEHAFIAVRINIKNSQLASEPACQSIIKKSIIESLKRKYKQETFSESGDRYDIFCYLNKNECSIALDTSGEGLFKRGYRQATVEAPIKENLAAGILKLCRWYPDIPLLDPFCGSATFCIEAAMIAENRAPGLNRMFAFQYFPFVSHKMYTECITEARDLIKKDEYTIIGADIDEKAVAAARENVEYTGLNVKIECKNAAKGVRFSDGFVVSNLPYGKRIGGTQQDIFTLYRKVSRIFFMRYNNVSVHVLTQFDGIEKIFQQKARSKRKLYNGKLKCRLFSFNGYKRQKKVDRG